MAQSNVVKLGIRPGTKVRVDGATTNDAARILDVPASIIERRGAAPVAVLFADDVAAVIARARSALTSTHEGGRTWVAYQMGASRRASEPGDVPLHRDTLQVALGELGLHGVTLVSLDDTWSALRIKA